MSSRLPLFLYLFLYSTAILPRVSKAQQVADFEYPNVTLTKLTFGSCHKRKYEFPEIWQRIQEQDAQVSASCRCMYSYLTCD